MRSRHHPETLAVKRDSGHVRAILPAEINTINAGIITTALFGLLESGPDPLILDLSETVFCSPQSVNVIVRTVLRARFLEAAVVLVAEPGGHVFRALEICGMSHLLPLVPTLEEALGRAAAPESPARGV
jgi:anti-anti-sigma regulatory factor